MTIKSKLSTNPGLIIIKPMFDNPLPVNSIHELEKNTINSLKNPKYQYKIFAVNKHNIQLKKANNLQKGVESLETRYFYEGSDIYIVTSSKIDKFVTFRNKVVSRFKEHRNSALSTWMTGVSYNKLEKAINDVEIELLGNHPQSS